MRVQNVTALALLVIHVAADSSGVAPNILGSAEQ
jgi:hypothetical protein